MTNHGSLALGVMQVCMACGAMLVAEPVSAAYPSAALAQPPSPCPPAADAPDRTAVGITGLLRREQQKEQRREDDMEQAFSDLSALTDKARQMVRPPPRVALPLLSVGVRVDGSTGVFMRSRSLYFLSASTGARSFIRESPNQEHLSWVSSHPSHQNPSTRAAYKRTSGSSEPPPTSGKRSAQRCTRGGGSEGLGVDSIHFLCLYVPSNGVPSLVAGEEGVPESKSDGIGGAVFDLPAHDRRVSR